MIKDFSEPREFRMIIRLNPTESLNLGNTGIIIANYSYEAKFVFSSDIKLKPSMKVDAPLQEEDLE